MAKVKKPSTKLMTLNESEKYVKDLLSKPVGFKRNDFLPGSLIFFKYDAKDKEQTYDKTPLVLVLGISGGYMLGLNFHWLPYQKRLWLVERVLEHSKGELKRKNRIRFTYEDFKPLMKSVHYQPCIRLYIFKRISPRGVVIPISELKAAQRLRQETFTNGKYSQQQLYQMAKNKYMKKKK